MHRQPASLLAEKPDMLMLKCLVGTLQILDYPMKTTGIGNCGVPAGKTCTFYLHHDFLVYDLDTLMRLIAETVPE